MPQIADRGYVHPERLVSSDWIADHLEDPNIRIVESNEDPLLYPSKHIPNAVEVDWTRDLNDQILRDYLDKSGFERLMSRISASPETTVVFYGDKNNWWACYAWWVFQLFGHTNAKIMDGGRLKWEKEGRDMTKEVPSFPGTSYQATQGRDDRTLRVFRDEVLKRTGSKDPLVDVRSPEEFTGERLHMPEYPNEGALRGGHIPGAHSIPWARAINPDDGTFRTAEELRAIYEVEKGLDSNDDVIVYCRIGERSSHTLFVLKELLGFQKVRNYDGSWTEYGNLVGVPIER